MASDDWKGILVPSEDCTDIYRRIFQELGIDDVVEVKTGDGPLLEAQRVGDFAKSSSKRPLVIGLGHHLMAFVGDNSVDYIYFDAHSDDSPDSRKSEILVSEREIWNKTDVSGKYVKSRKLETRVVELPYSLGPETFICFMGGKHYVVGIGEGVYPKRRKTSWFRHDELEEVLNQNFRKNVFLSYDIDVLDPTVTTAHLWGNAGRMFPEQIKDLSSRIVMGRNLVGMNVASYYPRRETDQNYKTINVIVDLLRPRL